METSMNVGKCGGCGTLVPVSAKSCPGCGESFKKSSWRSYIWIPVLAFIAIGFFFQPKTPTVADAKPGPSPSAKDLAERDQKAKLEDTRLTRVIVAMREVKKHLRDPDSLTWAEIGANDDGSVICMRYRAKNGFGGMNVQVAAVANNTLETGPTAWKRSCTKNPLHDMTFAGA